MLTKHQFFYDHTTKPAIGFQNPFYLKKAQQLEPKLYDGNVIEKTNAIVIRDSKETLMLAEESRSKFILKQKDPMLSEKKVNTTPIDYGVLKQLCQDSKTRFVSQTELSTEQAFWSQNSVNSPEPTPSSRPTKVEVPKELSKFSMVNTSLKKLKHHLASFDVVGKERTITTTVIDDTEEKVLVITALKDNIKKLKGKAVVDDVVTSHPIDPELLKVYVAQLGPKLQNNRIAHSDYLKHTQEETATLREIVKQAIQQKIKIQQTPSSTKKNKIEAHPRTVRSGLRNKNYVVKTKDIASMKNSKLNVNSNLQCVTCNGFLFFDNHDLCVLDFINNINARVKSISVKKTLKRKVWKPTGKVFTNIRYIWRPTGRTFTIIGNACPLTRITTTAKVPFGKPIALESNTPKPVVDISHETSVSCSPQQNGVVERRNYTLIEAARTMLIYAKASLFLWAEAVATVCYTQNRSIVCIHHEKTPYELLHDKLPDLSLFHVFGALCYPTNDSENLGKLQPKADIGIFIGCAPTKKAFWIYNRHTRRIIETIHVDFDELTTMASEQSSLRPALHEMTPVTISLGLVPNVTSSTPLVPPSRTDWDMIKAMQEKLNEFERLESKYALESLKKYGFKSCDPVDIPMVEKSKLDEDKEGKAVDPFQYLRMIGTLLYLTTSRPDLQFSICMCARYQAPPTEKHLHAVKKIFRLGFNKIPMYCDNKSVIALCCNNVQHSRSKHIDIRYHFIKEHVEYGVIEIYFVNTEYQLADIFTKALDREIIEFLINKLGMRSFTPETLQQLTDKVDE
nr:retrotransposon protein, putative, unclassified [Tanacetum cinerariifolium]